jgi:uncharacterized membrane protein YesL
MAAPRALWLALVGLYEETATLVGANLLWILTNLPLFALLAAIALPFATILEGSGPEWVLALIAWMLLFLPTPSGIALQAVTTVAAGPDVPKLSLFRATLSTQWRKATLCFVISLVVTVALLANVYFYAVFTSGVLRFATILWLYGALFWFSMHVYVVPLYVHIGTPRLFDLYKRAALIALGHPVYTLVLLLELLIVGTLALIFLPAYALIGPAFLAMVQAHAFREIRRRHGDLVEEVEEDVRL